MFYDGYLECGDGWPPYKIADDRNELYNAYDNAREDMQALIAILSGQNNAYPLDACLENLCDHLGVQFPRDKTFSLRGVA